MSLKVVYFQINDHFRRTIDGTADRCPLCSRPERFDALNGDFVKQDHNCIDDAEAPVYSSRSEPEPDNDDECTGARIGVGFLMLRLAGDL